ncbi:MAG: hydrogenase maturation protease [Pyrinomonadaceae bacterium]|jgi:hydrogenase maturation protease|nr:hydrogenase maturation protease [Pyrinomonadaceae bacterium]
MKILVAGVGNVLRGDDGFGVAVAQNLLATNKYGSEVTVFEAGIAGIALVQELMSGYDLLIIADTIHRGGDPGTIYIIEPQVPELDGKASYELHQSLADAHYSDPSKVLILAKALDVLPPKVFLIGCEPAGYDELGADLSPAVRRAVQVTLERIESLVADSSRSNNHS